MPRVMEVALDDVLDIEWSRHAHRRRGQAQFDFIFRLCAFDRPAPVLLRKHHGTVGRTMCREWRRVARMMV